MHTLGFLGEKLNQALVEAGGEPNLPDPDSLPAVAPFDENDHSVNPLQLLRRRILTHLVQYGEPDDGKDLEATSSLDSDWFLQTYFSTTQLGEHGPNVPITLKVFPEAENPLNNGTEYGFMYIGSRDVEYFPDDVRGSTFLRPADIYGLYVDVDLALTPAD